MSSDDFWKLLGMQPSSSPDDIKKRYRALARQYHPDNQDTGNANKFREIHHAYKMLTDPSYSYKDQPKNHAAVLKASITIQQAVFGATIIHKLTKLNYAMPKDNEGTTDSTICHNIAEIVDVIPKHTLRFPFSVLRSNVDFGNNETTNVVIEYYLQDDPYYKINKDCRLYVEISIEPMQALRGAKIEIQTLFGIRTLRIPPGTVPGDSLLIKKHGTLPPLIVVISDIKYPRQPEMKSNSAYSDLDIDWQSEEEALAQEQKELDELFIQLGGKPNP